MARRVVVWIWAVAVCVCLFSSKSVTVSVSVPMSVSGANGESRLWGRQAAAAAAAGREHTDFGDSTKANSQAKHWPVLLVPGLGGSQLWAKLTDKRSVPHVWCERHTDRYYNIWLSISHMLPEAIDCTLDNLRLHYNADSHSTRNTQGVDIQALHFGDPQSVEWLDPFAPHLGSDSPASGNPRNRNSDPVAFSQSRVFRNESFAKKNSFEDP